MTKFTDLNLNPKVLKAIEEAGYETPTPIQAGAIPPALEGRDVLGIESCAALALEFGLLAILLRFPLLLGLDSKLCLLCTLSFY